MQKTVLACLILASATPSWAQNKLWTERPNSAPVVQLPDFSPLAEQLVPAVVSIQVEQKVDLGQVHGQNPHGGRGGPGGDPFEFFFGPFGGEVPREFHNRGLGSGFAISKEGLILTNYHVVEDADSIEVTFSTKDGGEKKMSAKVLGVAPDYDVALIQTNEPADAAIAYLGDSDRVRIGEWVMAIGNPFGLSHSVSVGIISAKERRDIAPSGRNGVYNFLQTDASINPGNSGGPLINTRGEVIGINSAINAAGSGIGFAIPINMVKNMLGDLKSKGKYSRSWIGIKIQEITPELAQSYGLGKAGGALVAEVVDDSPAKEAGLQEGDVILEFDGKPVRASSDLSLIASMAGVGRKVSVKFWRSGKERTVTIKLSEFPSDETKLAAAGEAGESGSLGIVAADITPALQQRLQLEADTGVVIRSVEPSSVAARAGLRPGDLILSLNGETMKRARAFAEAVKKIEPGGLLRMQVQRQGGKIFVAFRKPAK